MNRHMHVTMFAQAEPAPAGGLGVPGLGPEISLIMYGGAVAVLLLFVAGLRLGWWHMDGEVREIVRDRDSLRKERDQLRGDLEQTKDQLGEWRLIAREAHVISARSTKTTVAMMAHRAEEEGPVPGSIGYDAGRRRAS